MKSIPVIKNITTLIRGREYLKDIINLVKGLERFTVSEYDIKKFTLDFCSWAATKPVDDKKALIKDFALFFKSAPLKATIGVYNKYYKNSDKHDFDSMAEEIRKN